MKQTVEIDVPDNMELVDVKPTFREKKLSYEDCVSNLKFNNTWEHIYISTTVNAGTILSLFSDSQAKKMEAINKMLVVAKYLNGDWKPDWENYDEEKFRVHIDESSVGVSYNVNFNYSICYFKTRTLAKQAIDILGEDTIRYALGDY